MKYEQNTKNIMESPNKLPQKEPKKDCYFEKIKNVGVELIVRGKKENY